MAKDVDILSFDAVSDSEQPIEVMMLNDDESETGVKLLVLGKHATAVEKWSANFYRKWSREEAQAKRTGKPANTKSYEELKAEDIDGTMVKVVGWKGVSNPFEQDTLKRALERNPHWRPQINEASDNYKNFTKAA